MEEKIIDKWLEGLKGKVKIRTFKRYVEIVKVHILPFVQDKEITKITGTEWEEFISAISKSGNTRTGKRLSENSIAQIIGLIKRLYRYMAKAELVSYDTVSDLSIKTKQKQIEVLTEFEQQKIEKDIIQRHSVREYGVIVALYTGLRLGELLALEWSDIDLRQRQIVVKKTLSQIKVSNAENPYIGTPKTDCGMRTIPFPKELVPILKEMRAKGSSYVVPGRCGGFVMISSYQRTFEKLLRKLNIKHRGFHSLRHTFATRAIERGADMKTLSEILGHSSPTITMARYVHSSEKQKFRLMDKVGAMLKYA